MTKRTNTTIKNVVTYTAGGVPGMTTPNARGSINTSSVSFVSFRLIPAHTPGIVVSYHIMHEVGVHITFLSIKEACL